MGVGAAAVAPAAAAAVGEGGVSMWPLLPQVLMLHLLLLAA